MLKRNFMFTIVKHAQHPVWEHHFLVDPKVEGVPPKMSAMYTHAGRAEKVHLIYEDKNEAKADCKRLNQSNVRGDYAVCPVVLG